MLIHNGYTNFQPDNNQSVVIGALPLGDECTLTLKGKYGETKLEYKTPECFEVQGCAPRKCLKENFCVLTMTRLKTTLDWIPHTYVFRRFSLP